MSRKPIPSDPPILTETTIAQIIAAPKPVDLMEWAAQLPPHHKPFYGNARLDIPDGLKDQPVRGDLHVYARKGLNANDYSVGLVYTDYSGHSYRIIRCNGPHAHIHKSRLDGSEFVNVPHVHRITEANQVSGQRHDNHAEPTDEFFDVVSALRHLGGLTNFVPSDTLFLW